MQTITSDNQVKPDELSPLALAYIGDAVYELMFRTYFCMQKSLSSRSLHAKTVKAVNAIAQAQAVSLIKEYLTAEETIIYNRGRNAKVNSVPHNASIAEYHAATGLEALFGWLYLNGEHERIDFLFSIIIGDNDGA